MAPKHTKGKKILTRHRKGVSRVAHPNQIPKAMTPEAEKPSQGQKTSVSLRPSPIQRQGTEVLPTPWFPPTALHTTGRWCNLLRHRLSWRNPQSWEPHLVLTVASKFSYCDEGGTCPFSALQRCFKQPPVKAIPASP